MAAVATRVRMRASRFGADGFAATRRTWPVMWRIVDEFAPTVPEILPDAVLALGEALAFGSWPAILIVLSGIVLVLVLLLNEPSQLDIDPRNLFGTTVLFAGLALLLAAVGTYGVLSYMVTERRREIGVRMALGASRSSVIGLVMKQGLQPTVIGVIVGVAGAFAANRMIASLLFGVQPTDTVTMAGVIATISTVAAVACWLPGWRASRLDPNVTLRAD